MLYRTLADLTLVVHLLFIAFAVAGGFAVLRWRGLVWLHVPCAVWGALIEFAGWICPLTPLENRLRRLGGESGYGGGFIERYLVPLIYPGDLTRELQIILGVAVVALNTVAYALVVRKWRGAGARGPASS